MNASKSRQPGKRFWQRRRRRHRRTIDQRTILLPESLESRNLLAGDVWQNVDLPLDVNADHVVSPVDALLVINELNTGGARSLSDGAPPQHPEYFYDVNGDEFLTPVDALIVLNALNGEGEGDNLVQIRLAVTDATGVPLADVSVGDDFELRAYVQDLTGRQDGGVFAAYLDVNYTSDFVNVAGDIEYGEHYANGLSGSTANVGLIDEVGAFDGFTELGPDELLLFRIPFEATAPGDVSFTPDPADLRPTHDVLVFGVPDGEPNGVVAPDRIMFVGTSVQVMGGANGAPVALPDEYEFAGAVLDVSAEEGVLANDVDPDGDTLTAVEVEPAQHGTIELRSDGSFTYQPEIGFTGVDSFTYVAADVGSSSEVTTVTITVNQLNQPPVAEGDLFLAVEDNPLASDTSVLANDTDPDGDSLTAILVSDVTNGSLTLDEDGNFTYTPNLNFNGVDSFQYRASDGTAQSEPATVTINVSAVNDPPVGVVDEYSIQKNGELAVAAIDGVLANDTDVEGDALTARVVDDPMHGSLEFSEDGSFTYLPSLDYTGSDSFTYIANDGRADSQLTTVSLTVTGEFLVRIRLETTTLQGTPISAISPGAQFLLKAYVQDVSELPRDGVFAAYMDVTYTADVVGSPGPIKFGDDFPNQQRGNTSNPGIIDEVGAFDGLVPLGSGELFLFSVPFTAQQEGVATFAADPAEDVPAHDILLFNDDLPIPSTQVDYGSVSISVEVGEPPTAVDDEYRTDEDVPLAVDVASGVLANDSDPDTPVLSAVIVDGPENGVLDFPGNGSFVYTPNPEFSGTDAFTYQATDGGSTSNVATVTITVTAIDDAPVARDDSYSVNASTPLVVEASNGVLQNDSDAEGDLMSAQQASNPQHGSLQFSSNGAFVYTPEAGFIGQDSFTYKVVANGLESNIATVTISVGDITPGSVAGYVYADVDNDGAMEAGEARIGGVTVTLSGTDVLGRDVSLTTQTHGDGSYAFGEVLAGEYVIREEQPMFLIDGRDIGPVAESLDNDLFRVVLSPAEELSDYNFGERGLSAEFVGNPYFFASRPREGMYTALDADGNVKWYWFDEGWEGMESVSVSVASNRTTAQLSVTDVFGDFETESVRLLGNSNVRTMPSQHSDGVLVRWNGSAEDYGFEIGEGEAEAEPDSIRNIAAIDEAFSRYR